MTGRSWRERRFITGAAATNAVGQDTGAGKGIYEIFQLDEEVRRLIYEKSQANVIRARARELGMRTLREDGVRKIMAGITTPEEVISITQGDES